MISNLKQHDPTWVGFLNVTLKTFGPVRRIHVGPMMSPFFDIREKNSIERKFENDIKET